MTTPQLQAECKRRGLPSGRVKAELVNRLTAADTEEAGADGDFADVEMTVEAEPEAVVHEVVPQAAAPEAAPPEPHRPVAVSRPVPGLPPTVFQYTFPATTEGPTEAEHAAFRATTIQAAVDAGRIPRGDARRVGTVNGREVYEVSVRAVN
jgi:hypothetical protein